MESELRTLTLGQESSDWAHLPALQQPVWPDSGVRDEVLAKLSQLPPLVFAGEVRTLQSEIAKAQTGESLVLQAGDCAEEFSRCHGPTIHSLLKVVLQMSIILTYAGGRNVVKIGRVAGQYSKPRSSDFETVGSESLPVYRGDMVNDSAPSLDQRRPDPNRMLEGYFRSTATLNLIRAFTSGGYASLEHVRSWNEDTSMQFGSNPRYEAMAQGIRRALRFMNLIGISQRAPELDQVSFYTSHEALILEYEAALRRKDTTTGDFYATSAHMLWLGDRTRQLDHAHVAFLSSVKNPIGVKIGPSCTPDELLRLAEKLNPENVAGRLTLITRFGVDQVETKLPPLIKAVQEAGPTVSWVCDPMHGNTRKSSSERKTRRYEDIVGEVRRFWDVHRATGTVPSGVHLELTGDAVTECLGGAHPFSEDDLHKNYQSTCDPRLNAEQAIELAFEIADSCLDTSETF